MPPLIYRFGYSVNPAHFTARSVQIPVSLSLILDPPSKLVEAEAGSDNGPLSCSSEELFFDGADIQEFSGSSKRTSIRVLISSLKKISLTEKLLESTCG